MKEVNWHQRRRVLLLAEMMYGVFVLLDRMGLKSLLPQIEVIATGRVDQLTDEEFEREWTKLFEEK